MQFSPYVLLRHPSYDLSRLDVFSIHSDEFDSIDEAIEDRRKYFLSFISSKDLLLSLPFSSKTVYQAIPHYEFHAAVKIRKKEKQTERALMKYLSRMSLNPSPLAAFAKSQFVDWEWNTMQPSYKFELSLSLTQRKEFFDLCYCDVGLQKYMRYRLNPSLRKRNEGFTYLHREGEEESRVELESDQEFEDMFNALNKKDFTFEQFASQTNYGVNDFLEAQLIVPSYPIYAEHKLIAALIADINEQHRLSFKLEDIIGIARNEFTDQEVITQQKHWETQMLSYARSLEVSLDHKLYPERVYYLNTYSEENIKKPDLQREEISKEVLRIIKIAEQSIIQEPSSPLNWDIAYERMGKNEPKFDLTNLDIEQKSQFEIELKLGAVDLASKFQAIGLMLQFSDHDQPKLINVSTPFGKFFVPGLELASKDIKSELKHWVQTTINNAVNLKDESLHTKNKAHGFLPELNSFGCDFQTPIDERISIDFSEDGRIVNDETREVLSVVNLGIEDFNTRSRIYQNLYQHSKVLPNLPVLVEAIQNEYKIKMDEYVDSMPKLVTNSLILGYRKWHIVKNGFESFQDAKQIHLEQLNNWRSIYQIPRVVGYSIDGGKVSFLDFLNHWSVDSFLKLVRKMNTSCALEDLGFTEVIKKKRMYEAYFEIKV